MSWVRAESTQFLDKFEGYLKEIKEFNIEDNDVTIKNLEKILADTRTCINLPNPPNEPNVAIAQLSDAFQTQIMQLFCITINYLTKHHPEKKLDHVIKKFFNAHKVLNEFFDACRYVDVALVMKNKINDFQELRRSEKVTNDIAAVSEQQISKIDKTLPTHAVVINISPTKSQQAGVSKTNSFALFGRCQRSQKTTLCSAIALGIGGAYPMLNFLSDALGPALDRMLHADETGFNHRNFFASIFIVIAILLFIRAIFAGAPMAGNDERRPLLTRS